MNKLNRITHWRPANILATNVEPTPFCLIILNQPLNRLDVFRRLWKNGKFSTFKFVADGGSNRLYDAFRDDTQSLEKYLPDEIRGDLDSIRPEVKSYYASKHVPITKVADQYSTDFMKCVALLKEKEAQMNQVFDVVAMPALGGRFDQTIASINMLYFMKDEVERKVILLSDENITVLLDKGTHHIQCLHDLEGPTCGIMPIGGPATMTTKGLRWNLGKSMDNHKCFFGGMVSTSNIIDSDLIEIETDAPLVWTIELK